MSGNQRNPDSDGLDRQGSVKRARQLLAAGVRPERVLPQHQLRHPPLPRNVSHQTQWPLPESGLPQQPINHHPRFLIPRGPPPPRPLHPSEIPHSPSIYSERDGQDSETSSQFTRPPRSFSSLQPPPPLQLRRPVVEAPVSPTSTVDMAPRISIATDDLFRQSTASTTASVPDVPPFPPPVPDDPRQRTAGLVAPASTQKTRARQSSVSPIQEELADPRHTKGSFASSMAVPSSWSSGPAESDIVGAYLDMDSDSEPTTQAEDSTLVRSASLGKRGKPTMRTITKSNPPSVRVADSQVDPDQVSPTSTAVVPIAMGPPANRMLQPPSQLRKGSTSTASSDSLTGIDPEKPPFSQEDRPYSTGLEKEMQVFGALPKAAPTMSDKRPWGRKPAALNMGAVRDAEARGSLSSLSDLIRRATKLASNLDHGRTASRADLFGGGEAEFKAQKGHRPRNSGSISDMLASFPPPGLATPESRGSWPVFFGRSNLRNVEPLGSHDDGPDAPRRKKMCCGMPRKWFVVMCIVIFIIVVLAVLLPVFLVAVPKENASKDTTCATSNPCSNGGVSVSSGSQCSCVCSNNYTGTRCTIPNDGGCTTYLIEDSTGTKNASMGTSLPTLFAVSKETYDLTLDPVTIMALFSMNDVSCKTENALVSFSDVPTNSSSSNNARRSLASPTPVLAPRAQATTDGGILYDPGSTTASATQTDSVTATRIGATATSTAETKASVPDDVVEFSRLAVLYILQKTGSVDTAMSSEKDIQEFLVDSYAKASWPTQQVGEFTVDFVNLTISLPNSTVKAD
ncbi:hypothetical protein N7541_005175 [Penicillium brevicompactum]|uniref:EGF-like domain-containing protein n=1 Tax=Penicillium brevicompactum TaxID=5074 RepID=A0A9W9UUN0_PENBR|nr:hypothetical protein N7541_005175 [Penicillium brevicompactum]